MTEGLKRYYGRNHLHFITTSCYHRLPNLDTAARRNLFLEILEEARQRFQFVVVGYVVMPEHVHLLMSETGLVNPSVVMKWVKFRLARRVLFDSAHTSRSNSEASTTSSKRDVWGTQPQTQDRLWQHRFYDFNVFTTAKVDEKLNYMHMNPVVRGLVGKPEDWPWSSARYYLLQEEGPVKINVGWPTLGALKRSS